MVPYKLFSIYWDINKPKESSIIKSNKIQLSKSEFAFKVNCISLFSMLLRMGGKKHKKTKYRVVESIFIWKGKKKDRTVKRFTTFFYPFDISFFYYFCFSKKKTPLVKITIFLDESQLWKCSFIYSVVPDNLFFFYINLMKSKVRGGWLINVLDWSVILWDNEYKLHRPQLQCNKIYLRL